MRLNERMKGINRKYTQTQVNWTQPGSYNQPFGTIYNKVVGVTRQKIKSTGISVISPTASTECRRLCSKQHNMTVSSDTPYTVISHI